MNELAGRDFSVILADPPWRYSFSRSKSRQIENHYPTMTTTEICELPISDIAARDCRLYLWTTRPKLCEGLRVLEAWGFLYVTSGVWLKDRIGMGYWNRDNAEFYLIGKRGKPKPPAPRFRIPSCVPGPRTAHSRKPDFLHEHIERAFPDEKKIELFARRPREGWSVWGNEVPGVVR